MNNVNATLSCFKDVEALVAGHVLPIGGYNEDGEFVMVCAGRTEEGLGRSYQVETLQNNGWSRINPDWNYSAPHGAGRVMSRKAARKDLSMADYQMDGRHRCLIDDLDLCFRSAGLDVELVTVQAELTAWIESEFIRGAKHEAAPEAAD